VVVVTDVNDDLIVPLEWSLKFVRQQKLIAALKAENALLRSRLSERDRFDVSADSVAIFKNQIGPTS
jgi:hypothetical protein